MEINNPGLDIGLAIPTVLGFIIVLAIICCIFGAVLASLVWLWRDADKHGQPGLIWAIITFFVAYPLGLIIWLVVRNSIKATDTTITN